MSEIDIADYSLTVGFECVSHDALYRLVTTFPLPFDSQDSMLQLWAYAARLPLVKDEVAVRRYLAVCVAHGIKPFSLTGYVATDDGLKNLGSYFVPVRLSPDLTSMVKDFRKSGKYVHNVVIKSFSRLSDRDLIFLMKDYDFGSANLPFFVPDDSIKNRRGHIKVVQKVPGTVESEPTLELYIGRDFGLTDESDCARIYHWFVEFVTCSR